MPQQDDTTEELTAEQDAIARGFERLRTLLHPQPDGSSSGSNRGGTSFDPAQIFPDDMAAAAQGAEVHAIARERDLDRDGQAALEQVRRECANLRQQLGEQTGQIYALKRERALLVDPEFDEKNAGQVGQRVNRIPKPDRARRLKPLLEYEQSKDNPRGDVLTELEQQYQRAVQQDAEAGDEDRSG